MKYYRKKEEIVAWKWEGDDLIIDEITKIIEPHNDVDWIFKVGFAYTGDKINKDILAVSHYDGVTSYNAFVRKGEYIIFNPTDFDIPFVGGYSEEFFNKKYKEI